MRAIGIGDLHLSSASGAGAWSKYYVGNSDEAILAEAQKAVDYGRDRGISQVFIYGDVCDAPKMSYQAHIALSHFFTRNSDMTFWVITGNHDVMGNGKTSCDLLLAFAHALPNVRIFTEPEVVEIEGVRVNFLPFPHAEFDPQMLNVCHVDVAGAQMDSGSDSKSTVDPKDCVVLAGHIHTAQQVKNVFYSGTVIQTRFDESEDKFFHVIRFNSPKDFDVTLRPTRPALILRNVTVYGVDDIQALKAEPGVLYRLMIQAGAKVSLSDYAHLNVAQVKSFATEEELQNLALSKIEYVSTEDIKPEDVFLEMLEKRTDLTEDMKKRVLAVRAKVLKAA